MSPDIQMWIDAASKIGVPAVFAFILLLKILPALEKIGDSLAVVGERLARIENEAEIKPIARRSKTDLPKNLGEARS